MVRRWIAVAGAVALAMAAGLSGGAAASAAAASGTGSGSGQASSPPWASACGAAEPGYASCPAIQLVDPYDNWHPGQFGHGAPGRPGRFATAATPAPPSSGYYPADLLSAYNLATAAASFGPGPSAPTVAIVDAYDDPNAASDLAAYRAALNGAQDTNTGLTDPTIPPLCGGSVTTGCVTFTKVSQTGSTTSYPSGNTGWADEISLDLDMVSAVCPDCNIVLVEASSASNANLAAAVTEAKTFHPASIGNSYGGGESSSETSYNSVYSAGTSTAVTVSSGDSSYGAEFPATAPGVTAVGGTSLSYSGSGNSLAWNPQTVWYDSSSEGAGSGCSTVETMPSWQNLQGVYSSSSDCTHRQEADVSAVADPNTGVATYDTYGESGWLVFGGTSVSAQIISATYGLAAGSAAGAGATFAPNAANLYPDTATNGQKGATPGLVPVKSGYNSTSCGNYLCNAADSLSSGYNGPTGLGTPYGINAFQTAPTVSAGTLSFSSSVGTLTAGSPSGSLTVDTSTPAGNSGLTVALSTTSAGGGFSTSPTGSFSASMQVSVGSGSSTSSAFYYRDTAAGSPTLTASASGWTSANQPVTVQAAPLAKITVTPSTATVAEGGTQAFSATGADTYGNPVTISPTWTASAGKVSPASGTSTTFTAPSSAGPVTVTASQGSVSASAGVTVTAEPSVAVTVTAGRATHTRGSYQVPLTVTARNATSGADIRGASVAIKVYSGATCTGTVAASSSGTTGSNGTVGVTFSTAKVGTWCASATVTASGYQSGTGSTTFSS